MKTNLSSVNSVRAAVQSVVDDDPVDSRHLSELNLPPVTRVAGRVGTCSEES